MLKTSQIKTVLAFGVFDVVHPGHIFFLRSAAQLGEKLIVVVAQDERVFLTKGKRPIMTLEERLTVVGSMEMVDMAVAGDPPGKWTALSQFNPDIVCLGYDQSINQPEHETQLKKMVNPPKIVRLPQFYSSGGCPISSTEIKKRLLDFETVVSNDSNMFSNLSVKLNIDSSSRS